MNHIVNTVEQYCKQENLLVPGGVVLAALSGGADSVCLLYLLKQLQPKWGFHLAAAHLHHGLRGDEAEADLVFSRELCQMLHIPFYERREDVAAAAKRQKCSVETAGRQLRYAFLNDAAKQFAAETKTDAADIRIATAHHKNDQAETVLMHLLRGSGVRGLAGIPPKRDCVIRPLLCLTREEIETYLAKNKLSYQTDSTNFCSDMTRNKIRLELLPLLKREYNDEIVDTLCRTAEIMRRQETEQERSAASFYEQYVAADEGENSVSVHALRALKPNVLYAVLCRMANGELQWRHMRAIQNLLAQNQTGSRVSLSQNQTASIAYGELHIGTEEEEKSEFLYSLRPGETIALKELGYTAGAAWVADGEEPNPSVHIMPYHGEPIQIRGRRQGDTIYTGGRTQRIKQMMMDAKIPRHKREQIPVVQVGDDVVWVYGLRHADTPQSSAKKIKIWIKEK